MQSVAGVFAERAAAELAAAKLEEVGVARDRVVVLAPGGDTRRVPTDEGERPGMGGVVGAVAGAAAGFPLGAALTLLIPGVGPVVASGLIGAALLGAGGAALGSTLEESMVTGLPRDELFVYEDALRRGRSVVVALIDDEALAAAARRALIAAGAETVDAAAEQWWVGLRSAEQERYADGPGAFARDEPLYRRGFEAALDVESRGRTWESVRDRLRARHGADAEAPAFRRGWERGQSYWRDFGDGPRLDKIA